MRAGRVRVDGQVVTKAGTRLRAGATVETELPEPASPALRLAPEAMDLPTLFEDARLWIIDKPSDLVVHPGPGHPVRDGAERPAGPPPRAAVVLAVAGNRPEDDEEDLPAAVWPGLVHRLDRYTTGCLAMAKDAPAQQALQRQFGNAPWRRATWPWRASAASSRRWGRCWWTSPSPGTGWNA